MASTIRVLCVDDEEELANLVATYLSDSTLNMEADPVTGGEAALDTVESGEYDCIVCDYQMPEMNGIKVLETLRERDFDIPFILFTGQGSENVASEAVRAGVSDYIPKSTGTDQYELLANRVRNAVDRHRARTTTSELFNAADDAIIVHDPDTAEIHDINRAGCELWGRSYDDLVGMTPDSLCVAADERAWLPDHPQETSGPRDWECIRGDGSTFWAEVRVQPASIEGEDRLLALSRDITRRRRREERLGELLEAAEGLVAERELEAIGSVVTTTMQRTLGFEGAALYTAETDEGTLTQVSVSGEIDLGDSDSAVEDQASEVFTVAGSAFRSDGGSAAAVANAVERDSLLFWPIAEYGVLVGDPGPTPLTPFTADLTELLVALSQASVVRTFQDQQLEHQHEELESLNHMNEVIRDINETLVRVSTRDEVEQLVCKQLAAAPPFVCAWIGDHDLAAEEVRVRIAVGRGADSMDEAAISTANDGADPLGAHLETVVQNREVVHLEDLRAESIGTEMSDTASDHGFESLTLVPITYQNALYDVLAIWAESPHPFGPQHRDVLGELGNTIGYAMHTAERSRALLSDTAIELEYHVRDDSSILYGLAAALDTTVDLERIFFRPDDSARLFLAVEGASTAAIRSELETIVDGSLSVRKISTRETETIVEVTVEGIPMMRHLAEEMASIRSATAEAGEGRLIIEVPNTVSVRTLTENLATVFDSISLLARRQQDLDDRSVTDVDDPSELGLTDRQHEVLLTAYHAGFFTWPRESTGEEIAELLDISQPTFHEHLRTGERKLLDLLFEHRRSVYS